MRKLWLVAAILGIYLCGCSSKQVDSQYGPVTQVDESVNLDNNKDKVVNVSSQPSGGEDATQEITPTLAPVIEEAGSNLFISLQDQISFAAPSQFQMYEKNGYIYFRDSKKGTQIAVIMHRKPYANSIEVADTIKAYITQMYCQFEEEERQVSTYGPDAKFSRQVGEFEVKTEDCDLQFWTMKRGEKDYKLTGYNYHTTYNGKGLTLVATSMSEEKDTLYAYMDSILLNMKPYTPTAEDKAIKSEKAVYESKGNDRVKFSYPATWEYTQKEGMNIFKAPVSCENFYSGVSIQYFTDPNYEIVEDYAQFAEMIDKKFLLAAFPVDSKTTTEGFSAQSVVTDVQLDTPIKGREGILFEVENIIYPSTAKMLNELVANGNHYTSIRYTFVCNGVPCVLNFMYPETVSKEDMQAFASQIVESIVIN